MRDLDLTEGMWADVAPRARGRARGDGPHSPAGWLGLVRDGRFAGWVSADDLGRASPSLDDLEPAPPAARVHPDSSLREALEIILTSHSAAAVVEDDDGRFSRSRASSRPSGGGWPGDPATSRCASPCSSASAAFAVWAKVRIDGLSHGDAGHQPDRPLGVGVPPRGHPHRALGRDPAAPQAHLHRGRRRASSSRRCSPPIALRLRWTFTPITAVTGFLYTIPSVALFGVLRSRYGSFAAAEVALVSYTLLVLVRNMVAGIDGVPGVGDRRRRRPRPDPHASAPHGGAAAGAAR